MSGHFSAFSFVDRLTLSLDGNRVEGCYRIPAGLSSFPSSLAGEAVGQLAAWAAMKAANFERRPVAGLAGRIDLLGAARPGQVLQLAADIQSLDAEAVAYGGSASVNGNTIIRLEECLGPMIPAAELDDPAALLERFNSLCGPGAEPGAFRDLPALPLQREGGECGSWVRATFVVPAAAPLFADHFPRRAVFPGSLLIQMGLELAAALASEIPATDSSRWRLQSILDMKLREFIPPGKALELEVRVKQRETDSATLSLVVRSGREIAGSARVLLVPEVCE